MMFEILFEITSAYCATYRVSCFAGDGAGAGLLLLSLTSKVIGANLVLVLTAGLLFLGGDGFFSGSLLDKLVPIILSVTL